MTVAKSTYFMPFARRNSAPMEAQKVYNEVRWIVAAQDEMVYWIEASADRLLVIEGEARAGQLQRRCVLAELDLELSAPDTFWNATAALAREAVFVELRTLEVARLFWVSRRGSAVREVARWRASGDGSTSWICGERDAFIARDRRAEIVDGATGNLSPFPASLPEGVLAAAHDGALFVMHRTTAIVPEDDTDKVANQTRIHRVESNGTTSLEFDRQCWVWDVVPDGDGLCISRSRLGISGNLPQVIAHIVRGQETKLLESDEEQSAQLRLVAPTAADFQRQRWATSIPVPFLFAADPSRIVAVPTSGKPTLGWTEPERLDFAAPITVLALPHETLAALNARGISTLDDLCIASIADENPDFAAGSFSGMPELLAHLNREREFQFGSTPLPSRYLRQREVTLDLPLPEENILCPDFEFGHVVGIRADGCWLVREDE